MKKDWELEVDGRKHTIQYRAGFGCKLIVDGEKHKVKSSNFFINVVDYLIKFGETECRLVVIGSNADLAVNGTFLKSQKPYEPVANTPAWVWVFTGISTLGGMFMGGIICLLIGRLMSNLYVQFALQKKTGVVIGCFVGCCVLQLIVMVGLSMAIISSGIY